MRSEPSPTRSRSRGQRTATGPMPVMISRSGRCPWRTSRWRPSAVSLSARQLSKAATSASTACASSAQAPLRKTSVSESAKLPGWESRKTLVSVTAYHSLYGSVDVKLCTSMPYPFVLEDLAIHLQAGADRPTRVRRRRPVDGSRLSTGRLRELAIWRRIIAPQPCIRWIHLDPNHDAAMRIGSEAPGRGPILQYGLKARSDIGSPPPRIVLGNRRQLCRQMPNPLY